MSLTPPQRKYLISRFDKWLDASKISCDDFLHELSLAFLAQAETVKHPTQRQCVETAAEHLSHASLAYYSSFK